MTVRASVGGPRRIRGLLLCSALVLLALLSLLSLPVMGERDFYSILGLKNDATDAQIKKAFRKLSLKYHPDKNKDDAAAAKMFMDVNDAHDVLSDPDKRQTYDLEGEEGLKREKEMAARGGSGSIFDLFGGGGMQGGKRKGPDFRVEFPVTLEELYNGASRSFKINRKVICKSCKGSGAKGGHTHTCPHCHGKGQVMSTQSLGPGFNIQMQTPCPHCSGKGKVAKHACPVCGGAKLQQEEKELDLVVERGMGDGHEVRFARASEQAPDTIPGDVIVTLRQQPHSRFTRRGADLFMEHRISLRDALLGHTSSFAHLDGHRVTLSTGGSVVQPEEVRVLKGEGMPQHEFQSERGDLHVTYKINFPKTLTAAQQEAVGKLFEEGK